MKLDSFIRLISHAYSANLIKGDELHLYKSKFCKECSEKIAFLVILSIKKWGKKK